MSVQARGDRFIVRWRAGGAQRSKSFTSHADASTFDLQVRQRRERNRATLYLKMFDQHLSGQEWVYIIQAGDWVKIGTSVNPRDRLAALQVGSALPLRLVWQINCTHAVLLEQALHRRYGLYREHGEWFEAEPVLEDIEGLAELGACQFVLVTPEIEACVECVEEPEA